MSGCCSLASFMAWASACGAATMWHHRTGNGGGGGMMGVELNGKKKMHEGNDENVGFTK